LNPTRCLVTEAPNTIAKEKSDSFQKQRNALAVADARAAQTIASPADIILSRIPQLGSTETRGTTLPQRSRWVLVRRWSSIRSKSSNRSKRFERLKRLERFEPRLSAPGLHLASGIFGLTAESGFI
jgi:hypothetical protein